MQKLQHGLDLSKLHSVFFTHSHTDHLDVAELTMRSVKSYCHISEEEPLAIYGNKKVCDTIKRGLHFEFEREAEPSFRILEIQPGDTCHAAEVAITAIPVRHDDRETCVVYLLRDGYGKSALYATDMGIPNDNTLNAIQSALCGQALDIAIMDCTFGLNPSKYPSHMGLPENLAFRRMLLERSCVDARTKFVATHFSHNCRADHAVLMEAMLPNGFEPAWDGLSFLY